MYICIHMITYKTTTVVKHSCPRLGTREGKCAGAVVSRWILAFGKKCYSTAPLDIESDCQFLCDVDYVLLRCVIENASSGPSMQDVTRLYKQCAQVNQIVCVCMICMCMGKSPTCVFVYTYCLNMLQSLNVSVYLFPWTETSPTPPPWFAHGRNPPRHSPQLPWQESPCCCSCWWRYLAPYHPAISSAHPPGREPQSWMSWTWRLCSCGISVQLHGIQWPKNPEPVLASRLMLNPTWTTGAPTLSFFLTSNFGGTHADCVCSCVLGSPALGLMEILLKVRKQWPFEQVLNVHVRYLDFLASSSTRMMLDSTFGKKNTSPQRIKAMFLTSNFGRTIKDNLCLCLLDSTKRWGSSPSDLSSNNPQQFWPCWLLEFKKKQGDFAWCSIPHWQKHSGENWCLWQAASLALCIDPSAWGEWQETGSQWWSSHWKSPDDWHATVSKVRSQAWHRNWSFFQHLSTPGCW